MSDNTFHTIVGFLALGFFALFVVLNYNDGYIKGKCDALGGRVIDGRCYKNIEEVK